MCNPATPVVMIGFALLAVPRTVRLARQGYWREAAVCIILTLAALVPAIGLMVGIRFPRITPPIDALFSRYLPGSLVRDLGFRAP